MPFFIDEDGVACAVGHLVIESGFADVAGEIAERENNARLLDMTHPALSGWIARSGLTAEECARIQPAYCGCDSEYAPVCGVDGNTYGNACYAETCAEVAIAHQGVCKPQESTSDWPDAGTSTGPGDSTGGDSSGGDSSGSETTGESTSDSEGHDGEHRRKSGCSLGQDAADAPALALLLVLAARRRRARS
ncbi:Kazal-type serine protease inhibitor family protein [Nannocystis pusilla]|uniref:Kazal-type serine protease inhibitor family protein n=1 Tax=Nannocystis pusilla TaxID=889268 RepID=UPI003B809B6B